MLVFRSSRLWKVVVSAVLLAGQAVEAIDIDVNDVDSMKDAAATAAFGMMSYYTANQTGQIPGKLPDTWWEGGAMFMGLIQYWHWTKDTSYINVTNEGMLLQAGEDANYMPSNWSNFLGNDDQVFWGFAAMTAAELKYPDVPDSPSWLSLAQAVFNTQAARWDEDTCGGGLRWQLFPYQVGYNSKNAISNGGFFQLAARLAWYTGNETYAQWANKMWDWSATTPLLITSNWTIDDIVQVDSDCKIHDLLQWTYNYGTYLMGAVYMYNHTDGNQTWADAVNGLLGTTLDLFYPEKYGGNIMSEVACEPRQNCNRNQICFKAFLSTWLAFTSILAPTTAPQIIPKLQASAQAAAKQCSGSDQENSLNAKGTACGTRWWQDTWDGTAGLEEQMAALGGISSALVTQDSVGPVKASTGGTSKSDPGAGTEPDENNGTPNLDNPGLDINITGADRFGASVLTVLISVGWAASCVWMVRE